MLRYRTIRISRPTVSSLREALCYLDNHTNKECREEEEGNDLWIPQTIRLLFLEANSSNSSFPSLAPLLLPINDKTIFLFHHRTRQVMMIRGASQLTAVASRTILKATVGRTATPNKLWNAGQQTQVSGDRYSWCRPPWDKLWWVHVYGLLNDSTKLGHCRVAAFQIRVRMYWESPYPSRLVGGKGNFGYPR